MNYPVWDTSFLGGGTWIGVIAILHVYISHLAVGGGIFIWLTDRKAWRDNSEALHDYLRRHVKFFMYLTLVFGGVSGVGIWFIIALVHPAGVSLLIHNFVFGWAIEWVFFFAEIAALLLYAYRFDRLGRRERQQLAFFYALFAWLSLFIINGILSFMLTPGKWIETGGFWDGFLNPTFFPSLLFRTAMSCMIAGIFGYVTAQSVKSGEYVNAFMRYCSKWLLYPLPVAAVTAAWYYYAVSPAVRDTAFELNRQSGPFVAVFLGASLCLFIAGVLLSMKQASPIRKAAVAVVVVIGLGWIGGFEYIREIARKPYLIGDYLYSNAILKTQVTALDKGGVLPAARWTQVRDVTPGNRLEAGREMFNLQCRSCHTVGGIRNDILKQTEHLTYGGLLAQLTGQGKVLGYMPPVIGTAKEREALAVYLASLHKLELKEGPEPYRIPPIAPAVPDRAPKDGAFVLLSWNDLGMHCVSDGDEAFVFLPPANTLEAQLIARGAVPKIVGGDEYELTFRVEKGFENPAAHVRFWDFSASNFGKALPANVGLGGLSLAGAFKYEPEKRSFIAPMIPVVPYPDGGGFNPYPLFRVEAKEKKTGRVVAATNVVAPVSTEMGCRNCHGGKWRVDGLAGLSRETADNILRVHDQHNRTTLYRDAQAGKPHLCQSCHPDVVLGAKGKPGVLFFSAAMHGWHANYMYKSGSDACNLCHPSDPQGRTRCSRGIHNVNGLTCINCHGTIADHALALLKGQKEHPSAVRLSEPLVPVVAPSKERIVGRNGWMNEPDCLGCHRDFKPPQPGATSYNQWSDGWKGLYRNRTDNIGVRCAACHGSTHAEYPALNPYSPMRDNTVPLQFGGSPLPIGSESGCEVCHTKPMGMPLHHENMKRPFRSKARWDRTLTENRAAGTDPGRAPVAR